jgi:hypothetical protein
MIGMPVYTGRVCTQTMRCLMRDSIKLLLRGDKFCFAEDLGNSDIAGSRGAILATFYRSSCDTLVFVDDDVFWEENALLKIIDHPVDLCGGVYPRKKDPIEFPLRLDVKDSYPADPETGMVEVAGLPGGFMKISRNCVEQMVKAYPKHTKRGLHDSSEFWPVFDPYDLPDDRLSEDLAFCQRWRDIGGKVWADFEFEMGHVGTKSYVAHIGNYLRSFQNDVK